MILLLLLGSTFYAFNPNLDGNVCIEYFDLYFRGSKNYRDFHEFDVRRVPL